MKTAVATIAFGNAFNALAEVTHPTLRAYAKKIGADFVVLTQPKIPNPEHQAYLYSYEKSQLAGLLSVYDRIIYLDTDVIVSPECPNLFEVVPVGNFGAFSEGKWMDRGEALHYAELQWPHPEYSGISVKWRKNYFNAGVMVFDTSHQDVFMLPKVLHNNFYDQTWFNCQVALQCPTKFQDFTHAFNRMPHLAWSSRLEAFIIHYAGGGPNRNLEIIRQDIAAWKNA